MWHRTKIFSFPLSLSLKHTHLSLPFHFISFHISLILISHTLSLSHTHTHTNTHTFNAWSDHEIPVTNFDFECKNSPSLPFIPSLSSLPLSSLSLCFVFFVSNFLTDRPSPFGKQKFLERMNFFFLLFLFYLQQKCPKKHLFIDFSAAASQLFDSFLMRFHNF